NCCTYSSSLYEERTTTLDLGICLLICRVASSPLSEGIPMSMTITSGRKRLAICTAWRPLSASPTTFRSFSALSNVRMPCRTIVWSSANITVIFAIQPEVNVCLQWRRSISVSNAYSSAPLRLNHLLSILPDAGGYWESGQVGDDRIL